MYRRVDLHNWTNLYVKHMMDELIPLLRPLLANSFYGNSWQMYSLVYSHCSKLEEPFQINQVLNQLGAYLSSNEVKDIVFQRAAQFKDESLDPSSMSFVQSTYRILCDRILRG